MQKKYGKYMADWRDVSRQAAPRRFPTPKKKPSLTQKLMRAARETPNEATRWPRSREAAEEFEQAQKHNPNTKAALYGARQGERLGKLDTQLTADESPSRLCDVARNSRSTRAPRTRNVSVASSAGSKKSARRRITISRAVPKFHQPQPRGTIATDRRTRSPLSRRRTRSPLLHPALWRSRYPSPHRRSNDVGQLTTRNAIPHLQHQGQRAPDTSGDSGDRRHASNSFPQNTARNVPIVALLHKGRPMGKEPAHVENDGGSSRSESEFETNSASTISGGRAPRKSGKPRTTFASCSTSLDTAA